MPPALSVCVPVYRAHEPPNLATLAASLPAALGGLTGELVVALNGITAAEAGVPADARSVDLGINRGVAPGWNAAAGAASAPVLVFANDDVVPGPGSLKVLHDALVGRDDGVSPRLRLDAVGRHRIGAGSSQQAILEALVVEPLERIGRRLVDVDKYATELQNADDVLLFVNCFATPDCATVPLRLSRVPTAVAPGATASWKFGSAKGEVKADAQGVVTISGLRLTVEPTTLSVTIAK